MGRDHRRSSPGSTASLWKRTRASNRAPLAPQFQAIWGYLLKQGCAILRCFRPPMCKYKQQFLLGLQKLRTGAASRRGTMGYRHGCVKQTCCLQRRGEDGRPWVPKAFEELTYPGTSQGSFRDATVFGRSQRLLAWCSALRPCCLMCPPPRCVGRGHQHQALSARPRQQLGLLPVLDLTCISKPHPAHRHRGSAGAGRAVCLPQTWEAVGGGPC